MLIFDIETNGLLLEMDRIHVLCLMDTSTGATERYDKGDVERGVRRLHGQKVCGHNVVGFDIPALQKIFPWFQPGEAVDTLIYSRLAFPDMFGVDMARRKKGKPVPEGGKLGGHGLAAWGERLGVGKDDYSKRMKEKGLDPWAEWNEEMALYCEQDVVVTKALWDVLSTRDIPAEVLKLEHDVQRIITRQYLRGFTVDEKKAHELHARLVEHKLRLEAQLHKVFSPRYRFDGRLIPKRPNRKMGYVEGAALTKVKLTPFNPSSRDHIAEWLISEYGWVPKELTDGGKPKVDEEALSGLPWEGAQLAKEYLMVDKRLGQLAEGNQAILKQIRGDGRVHGEVNPLGAVTRRMTHSRPNVAQTPANGAEYGKDFRGLYKASPGYKLVGCDAEGLELRCLAHYMARWDGGAYGEAVVNGDKSEGTDAHTKNRKAVGLNSRDNAKTWIYAFLYGAGDFKLGRIMLDDSTPEQRQGLGRITEGTLRKMGSTSRNRIARGIPALGALVKAVKEAAKKGFILSLDGAKTHVRAQHSALNTLLQGAGAIVMKRALVIADEEAQRRGWVPGEDYEWVANIHDEVQAEVRPVIAEEFGQMCAASITKAGEFYNFRCRLDGDYAIGDSWAETH